MHRGETLLQEGPEPIRRLSDAFSDRSILGQRPGAGGGSGDSPAYSLNTPQGPTPTSRMGTGPEPASGYPSSRRTGGPATGDLLTGEPFGGQGRGVRSPYGAGLETPLGNAQVSAAAVGQSEREVLLWKLSLSLEARFQI